MFPALQKEILKRAFAVERHFREQVAHLSPPAIVTAKGMAFVQMYALHEYTLITAVAAGLNLLELHSLKHSEIRPELRALMLFPELQSIRDCTKEKLWKNHLSLFFKVDSADAATAPPGAFPSAACQYRQSQVEMIWTVFGIAVPIVPDPLLYPLINEVVENRNAVAHGRKTAEEVGRRYSDDDMKEKIQQMQSLCLYVASTIESHCSVLANVGITRVI